LTIGNTDKEIQYYLSNYNGLKKCKCIIKIIWKEAINNPDCYIDFEYIIENSTSDLKYATLNLMSMLDENNIKTPKMVYSKYRCQHNFFKDSKCGYSGATEKCNRTKTDCELLGNIERFLAFPSIPEQFNKVI
jgi:phage-related protein